MTKKYPIEVILDRAAKLGIVLWISNNGIQADGPTGTLSEKFRQTIAEHRRELLAVLPAELCRTCLDAGKETRATFAGPDAIMYCEQHKPTQGALCFHG